MKKLQNVGTKSAFTSILFSASKEVEYMYRVCSNDTPEDSLNK